MSFLLDLVAVFGALVLSAGAIYTGISLLDSLTPGIDEWKQIKKGNIAVGIFYAAVILSLIFLVAPRIADFLGFIALDLQFYSLIIAFVNYLFGLVLATGIIYLAIHIIDKLTEDLDEMEQLEKGNIALALIMSVALLSIVFVASPHLESAFEILKSAEGLATSA